ncbi:response regulator [Brumimicrobium aurantiacum]|uniref:Response regulator n=1 Tax=Brumimicrobium aurantiacum TaxID=1737063 RepID=A0A3E1EW77_9FLAO|nr:response regulator [Brumimicrobium aurantiacum]RFC53797.1 response regulator [Brumimicrobium aurantiacum]
MKQPVLLIVDDEKDIRALYHSIVNRNFDFGIIEAESLEAVKNLLPHTVPDFVLLDLCLKDGSGFDVIPALKKVNPEVKILIITAFNHCKEKRKAVEMGAVGLLAKPFDQNQLIDHLKTMHYPD